MTFADPDRFFTAKPLHRCDESDLLRTENTKLRAALQAFQDYSDDIGLCAVCDNPTEECDADPCAGGSARLALAEPTKAAAATAVHTKEPTK